MVMIQMVRVAWLISCVLCLAIPAVVWGGETKITLDEATRAAGYTMTLGRLDVGIQANSLDTATRAWVRTIQHPPELPDHLLPLSKVYSFTVQGEENGLTEPVQLQYQLRGKKYKYDRYIYYYNSSQQQWEKLTTALHRKERTVTAEMHTTYAKVVVAADTTDPFGPSPVADFVAFGDISAAAAIAIDEATGDVLYSKHSGDVRSMASMTKLMTAYVLFAEGVDLTATATYHDRYDQIGGALAVTEGETILMEDLMYAMVVGSANNAAYALVGNAGYSVSEFVALMNSYADDLGLDQTEFADPSGLAVGNLTTASDYAKLMKQVLTNTTLAEMSATSYYEFTTINYQTFHDFNNTNSLLLTSDLDITGSKTGYIDEALYCLAMRTQQDGHNIITVVMGAPTLSDRTHETERLTNWAFENYQW